MAQHGRKLDRGKLCCPVCLDLLKDPVTIPCGHSFCMKCTDKHWNEEDQKGAYSCPCCRQNFPLRPTLVKNTTLLELVEELKKAEEYASSADHHYAGPEDVACDVCTGKKIKAVKSCLMCMVSYCQQHLQPHYKSSAFEEHKLVNPSKGLKESICSRHKEVKKIFCCTDQKCICFRCSMEEHKCHNTVTVEAERAEKQKELDVSLQEVQRRIKIREEEVKVLQQEVVAIKESADEAMKDSETFVNELISFIKEKGSVLKQQIKSQQKAEIRRVKEHQQKLEEEIAQLKKEDTELQQLSCTEDHTQFLLRYAPSNISESKDLPRLNTRPVNYFKDVQNMVTEARGKVKEIMDDMYGKISVSVKSVDILLPKAEPNTRDEFLKYFCELTLDPNTASGVLTLSNKNRTVIELESNPEMFFFEKQVLSKESLTGRCYWEVEWKGKGVSVAVAYKNKSTWLKGFGKNENSWALHCYKKYYEFTHNNITTRISGPKTLKVGVYLDHRAGILSFYSISDTMTLLHRVQTTFTQPLYAGIWIWMSFVTMTSATLSDVN